MDINQIKEQFMNYKNIMLGLNYATVGIFLCVIIILLSQNKKKYFETGSGFYVHIGVVFLALVFEIGFLYTGFNPEQKELYKAFATLSSAFVWYIPASLLYLVVRLLDYRVRFHKKIYLIYLFAYVVCGTLLLVPNFRELVFTFDEVNCFCVPTEFSYIYYGFEAALILISLLFAFTKMKNISVRTTLVGSLFIVAQSLFVILNEWWCSSVLLTFTGLHIIIVYGITYQNRLKLSMENENKKQVELVDAKNKLLLSQIQPHFLYNSLTTLKFLCETDPIKASELCDNFSNYLRANIDAATDAGLVPFEKELTNIENYLKIEQARFGIRVKYKFDIEEMNFLIPVLSIQTIVENAVKKGICKKKNGGTINVSTKKTDSSYIIVVSDDGIGFDVDEYHKDRKNHVGLINTKERIEMIDGSVKVESVINVGTKVTVTIPRGIEK